ncbi:MAG: serine/threonine protein kinase, partial [Actinomycetota bacterium]|nr:serine/threonine protein kinase [Actinomycetota bacterium]
MTWGDVTETPSGGVRVTLGAYRLVQKLGEGGMGVVHLGLDAHGRAVAIKVLRAHIAYDPDARARLNREVATLTRVRHPLVAEVLDADVDGDQPYVVTRYVPGPTLEAEVRERGPMPAGHLVQLGRGLSGALEAIHAAGVVHRDLKPGNVLMLDGDPVVIDFGIAHVADDVRLTMTGLVMGTPGYLSPELVEGSAVTPATDWWGWAATLAFAASGQAPFGRGPTDVVIDRVRRGAADLSGVDQRLRPLLLAALSPDPRRRPGAGEVLSALERFGSGGSATVAVPAVA